MGRARKAKAFFIMWASQALYRLDAESGKLRECLTLSPVSPSPYHGATPLLPQPISLSPYEGDRVDKASSGRMHFALWHPRNIGQTSIEALDKELEERLEHLKHFLKESGLL